MLRLCPERCFPQLLFHFFAAPPGVAVQQGVAEVFQIVLFFPAVQVVSVPSPPANDDVLPVRNILKGL